jgi:putative membrane protein
MHKLTKSEKERIADAVREAEQKTSGEIATAIIVQSYDYAVYELLSAVLVGMLYAVMIFLLSADIESFLQSSFWDYHVYLLTGFYLFSTFLVILLVYLLANIPSIDRLIVPARTRNGWVRRRAWQHFFESGVGHTAERSGILIFISQLEHRVELLADSGIAEKVPAASWENLVESIVSGVKEGRLVDRLCQAISECGEILAKEFPRQDDDVNELSDEIVELER